MLSRAGLIAAIRSQELTLWRRTARASFAVRGSLNLFLLRDRCAVPAGCFASSPVTVLASIVRPVESRQRCDCTTCGFLVGLLPRPLWLVAWGGVRHSASRLRMSLRAIGESLSASSFALLQTMRILSRMHALPGVPVSGLNQSHKRRR
jgi:hypothetical protein